MARLNIFQRAAQAIERTVQAARSEIEKNTQQAVNAVRSLGETIVSPFRRNQPTEDEIYQRREDALRKLYQQETTYKEELIQQAADYDDYLRAAGSGAVSVTEYLLLKWGATDEDRNSLRRSHMNIYESADDANLGKTDRVRRKPHPTLQSAAEYSYDVPSGYVIGITKIGAFYYVMVEDGDSTTRKRTRKSRKNRKRRNRRVS